MEAMLYLSAGLVFMYVGVGNPRLTRNGSRWLSSLFSQAGMLQQMLKPVVVACSQHQAFLRQPSVPFFMTVKGIT